MKRWASDWWRGGLLGVGLAGAGLCGTGAWGDVQAQVSTVAGAGRRLTFTLDRSGAGAVHYSIELDEATGKGVYRVGTPGTVTGSAASPAVGLPAEGAAADAGQPMTVPAAELAKLFAAVPLVKGNRCESHRKGIAQTGVKTLRLVQGEVVAECHYNYSDDERVNEATTVFEGLAQTMEYGDRLRAKLRFDRLGLDAEMEGLEAALKDGRALDVGNIAPVLQRIGEDDRVMERVRRRAALLLETAGVTPR